jgi:hypothetical protein
MIVDIKARNVRTVSSLRRFHGGVYLESMAPIRPSRQRVVAGFAKTGGWVASAALSTGAPSRMVRPQP